MRVLQGLTLGLLAIPGLADEVASSADGGLLVASQDAMEPAVQAHEGVVVDPETVEEVTPGNGLDQEQSSIEEATATSSEGPAGDEALPSVTLGFAENMFAGSVARMVAQGLLHPIDTVRTRRQARGVTGSSWRPSTLVRGFTPQFLLSGPAGAVQWGSLEWTKAQLLRLNATVALDPNVVNLAAGVAGATVAAVVRVPQEVLKQRVQAGLHDNVGDAWRDIYGRGLLPRRGTFGELYSGTVATITRDAPWNGLSYVFFQQLRKLHQTYKGVAAEGSTNLALGAVGGAFAAVLTHPIDIIKTRIMTARTKAEAPRGVVAGVVGLVREEGIMALTKGLLPRLAFLSPLASLILATYEAVASQLLLAKRGKLAEGLVAKHDSNGDGCLTASELQQALGLTSEGRARALVDAWDVDGSTPGVDAAEMTSLLVSL